MRQVRGKSAVCVTPRTLSSADIVGFQQSIYAFYKRRRRSLPWRRTRDAYKILVSEIMLQQTQVKRVLEKYDGFIKQFPSLSALARAPLAEVLAAWQGMGYNRRALYLKKTAELVARYPRQRLPRDPLLLRQLPGIGVYTANAVAAFAYNMPTIVIETNIRGVFLHHFFPGQAGISDGHIVPLIEQTLDKTAPRRWYSALMDYGADLKSRMENPGRNSAHYSRQAAFSGSQRQARGHVLKLLLQRQRLRETDFYQEVGFNAEKLIAGARDLCREGFIRCYGGVYEVVK